MNSVNNCVLFFRKDAHVLKSLNLGKIAQPSEPCLEMEVLHRIPGQIRSLPPVM
jgi:hypothetical protein